MKKRIMAALLASACVLAVAGCGNSTPATTTAAQGGNDTPAATDAPAAGTDAATTDAAPVESNGDKDVFNIYAWNEEFKGFFEKYMPGYDAAAATLNGVPVNWVINTSDGGLYQQKLDEALNNQGSAAKGDKVDMFLAEADYIVKYVDSDLTMDIAGLGLSQVDTEYQYTVSAASDANGKIKGVSFQCCPSALIYRRSIAKEVIGSDDPADVQAALDSWSKYAEVAAKAKDLGYTMHASFAETYRVFSNNSTSPWVTNGELTIPAVVEQWTEQAKSFYDNGYILDTLPGVWDEPKTNEMYATGKSMCFFGPAWYFNFCMTNAQDAEKGCSGDWAICKGPQAHFWGGTWILAATGTDNPDLVAEVMKAFTENEDVCEKLIVNEGQFTNNKKVNEKFANDPSFGVEFLGGQNATAVFCEMTDAIKWENATNYDQLCNEGYQNYIKTYIKGEKDKDAALADFYTYIKGEYPSITTPQG